MLKITKGLNPHLGTGDGVSIYTDSKGDEYVRVKMKSEDFCIAAHDYVKDGHYKFTWDGAMEMLEADGLTTFTKEQVHLCAEHRIEINDKLKEIGNDFKKVWYWTSSECEYNGFAWVYDSKDDDGIHFTPCNKELFYMVRPIINL